MERIKSYYLTEKEIVVKYMDKTEARYELNPINLRNIISKLDKQIDFNITSVKSDLDTVYDSLYSKVKEGLIVEMIIVASILLSFITGVMITFVITSLLSCVWFGILVKNLYPDAIKLFSLNKSTKLYEDRQTLTKEYNVLTTNDDTNTLIHVY